MKTSLIFYSNGSKKSKRTGKVPIYMRIIMNGKKTESRLNAELNQDQIERWDTFSMRISKERNCPINHYLNRLEDRFQEFIHFRMTGFSNQGTNSIKDFIIGGNSGANKTLMEFIDSYFENAILKNCNVKPGTVKQYRRSINHIKRFLETRKQKSATMDLLDYEMAIGFKQYLVSSDPLINKVGMTEVSAATVIKKMRTIFSHAVDLELIKKNPFKAVKIKTKSPRKERLTVHQLKNLYHLDLSEMPYQQLYKDIFLFSVFTGLSYKDLMELNWSCLEERHDSIKMTITRVKSDIVTELFFTSFAREIALKYRPSIYNSEQKVLPTRSNKELNRQFKLIGNSASIPFKLTCHSARHTFRQILSEAGIVNYAIIKRMMGQSRGGDVDEIYYEVNENGLLEGKQKLQTYLSLNI